jgi:hypothetical protein
MYKGHFRIAGGMMMKRSSFILISICIIGLSGFLSGCVSVTEAKKPETSGPKESQAEAAAPAWIQQHPGNVEGYFIGIGSSHTGNTLREELQVPITTQAGAAPHITVKKGLRNLYSMETEEIKDGGLDKDQARERALAKLLDALEQNSDLAQNITKAVTYQ